MTQRKYFGTDGIRGKTGDAVINAEFMLRLGWATGKVMSRPTGTRVVIGKDTRISGYMFESALEAGFSAAGADILLLGPMPTPAIAYLTRTFHAQIGVVISASHNAYDDNGVKFFSGVGEKIPDDVELGIEQMLEQPLRTVSAESLGRAERITDAEGRYIEFCKRAFPEQFDLSGMRIVVDCAHGATYKVAPSVFHELGAKVHAIGCEPDGLNINRGFGSTAPTNLIREVVAQGADFGIAFDGDGDRVVMVDGAGELVDGDELLCIVASDRHERGVLHGGVVGTLMTNLGMEIALRERDIPFERAAVGDRYVLEKLKSCGWQLGGEGSGHIICLDKTTTGDGIVSSLQVVSAMVSSGKSLSDLKRAMAKYPQKLINVRLKPGFDLDSCAPVTDAVSDVESSLGRRGRVLLRKSGTEPVVRVMVEGEDATEIDLLAGQLARAVEEAVAAA